MTGSNDYSDSAEISTPFPKIIDDDLTTEKERDVTPRKRVDTAIRRKSGSGNLLSRLPFLRTNSDQDKSDGAEDEPTVVKGAIAEVQSKRRIRKGSLRKTVLGKGRDRKGSDNRKSPLSTPTSSPIESPIQPISRPNIDLSSPLSPESPPRWPFRTLSRASIPSIRSSIASVDPASSAASATSPTMATDASTDDEELILPRMPGIRKIPLTSTDSYFPVQEPMRRIFSGRFKSPLASQTQSIAGSPDEEDEWDYSETAFWGYIILIVTWIVFVVGMGSCFGVWSWAWAVGSTPYAPPELEDDPTLPIVGYYPALLVLTCIMAWVWVVVAWVGMKYFRHADFKGDDG